MFVPGSNRRRRQRRHLEEWAKHLQGALAEMLVVGEGNSTNERSRPSMRLLSVSDGGTHLEIELRFEAGKSYCCVEPTCHLPAFDLAWWTKLRGVLAAHSDRVPPPFTLVVLCVIEADARIRSHKAIGLEELAAAAIFRYGPIREQEAG